MEALAISAMRESSSVQRAAAAAVAALREAHCSLLARLLESEETARSRAL